MAVTVTVTLDISDGVYRAVKECARRRGQTVTAVVEQALWGYVDDVDDSWAAREALDAYMRDGRASRPIDALWGECCLG